jgi:hypothetical protein
MNNLRWFHDKQNQELEAELPMDNCWVWDAGSRCFNTHAERLMFAVTWQMIGEFAEQHIVTLRSLLGQFTDRHCSDPRDRVCHGIRQPRDSAPWNSHTPQIKVPRYEETKCESADCLTEETVILRGNTARPLDLGQKRKVPELSEVPGIDGHVENDNWVTGLSPGSSIATVV